jgi:hypothetical protein
MQSPHRLLLCRSGRHAWTSLADRRRCCNGWVRVQSDRREDLEAMNAEHVVFRQLWRGWVRADRLPRP